MSSLPAACRGPVPPDTLLAYWFGELDDTQTQAVDLHLLACDACGAEVDALAALGRAVRAAFDAGHVGAVVDERFAQHLAARGLRVREYRVAPGASVNCSVGPDDDVVISRLAAPLGGVTRLDLLLLGASGQPGVRAADIPFDAARGEILVAQPTARLRTLPAGAERVRLLAVDAQGERVLGDYTFNHANAGPASPMNPGDTR